MVTYVYGSLEKGSSPDLGTHAFGEHQSMAASLANRPARRSMHAAINAGWCGQTTQGTGFRTSIAMQAAVLHSALTVAAFAFGGASRFDGHGTNPDAMGNWPFSGCSSALSCAVRCGSIQPNSERMW